MNKIWYIVLKTYTLKKISFVINLLQSKNITLDNSLNNNIVTTIISPENQHHTTHQLFYNINL